MRRLLLLVMLSALALAPVACNDSDDDGGGPTNGEDDLYGVLFTAANAEHLAGVAASTLDFFSGINRAFLQVLDAIETHGFYDGYPMPEEGYDLGDLGICSTGTVVAKWMDLDDSRSLSRGDTVHLDITDCDGEVSGTLDLAFTSASTELTGAEITYDLVIEEILDGTPQTETISADYTVEVYEDPAYDVLAVSHQVADKTDGGAGLTTAIDGETAFEIGCFHIYFSMNVETGGFRISEPFAVFEVADEGVMTMSSQSMEFFDFSRSDAPVSGDCFLRAEAGTTPCSRLDVSGDGVVSNASYLRLTVIEDGTVTLAGETDDGEDILVVSSWDELR